MARSLLTATSLLGAFAALAVGPARHDTWIQVRSPNFIVLSNAGEKQARKTAVQFEQIRSVFRQSLPALSAHPSPVITIFAAKDEDTIKSLLSEYWAKGHSHPAGIFYVRMNQYYAAVNLEAQGSNPYETIYHEYYHSLTLPYFPDLPLWLAEGLAEFFGNTEISSDHASLGLPDKDLIYELQNSGGLIPLGVLLKVDHSSPYYNEANKTSIFYAESWALTHYLMIGDREAHKPALANYLNALNHGKTQDEAAASTFGDLKKLQESLERYIHGYTFFFQKAPPPPKVPDSDLQTRAVSDAELAAMKGGFLAARGRNNEARAALNESILLDSKLAIAHQNLALVDFYEHHGDAALASVSRAVELDPQNAFTHFLRAYLTFFGTDIASNAPQVEDDLGKALSLDPTFTPSYNLLAVYLSTTGDKLPEALKLAQKANSDEPGNSNYVLTMAQVLARMRRFDDAQSIAMHARAAAIAPEERANAENFLSFLAEARTFPPSRGPEPEATVRAEMPAESARATDVPAAAPDRENEEYEQALQGTKRATITGKVLSVTCDGSDLRLTLLSKGAEFTLRARNYTKVDFTTTGVPPDGVFLPCKQLSGLDARIAFLPAENQSRGAIQSIELHDAGARPPTSSAAASSSSAPQSSRPAAPGQTRDIAGNVTQSRCHDRQLDIDVMTSSGPMHFHALRGEFRLALPPRLAQSGFDVCSQLKGQRVAVRFSADAEGASDITMAALRVLAAGAAAGGASSPAPSARRAHVDLDPTITPTADGTVTEVTCTGNEMLVKLQSGERQLTLHARDYTRINFDQDVRFDTKEFQPCTQLKDRTASITYTLVNNKPYNGEIQSVEVAR